jgi:hypothetical protein
VSLNENVKWAKMRIQRPNYIANTPIGEEKKLVSQKNTPTEFLYGSKNAESKFFARDENNIYVLNILNGEINTKNVYAYLK